jgi:hypothetical protein
LNAEPALTLVSATTTGVAPFMMNVPAAIGMRVACGPPLSTAMKPLVGAP